MSKEIIINKTKDRARIAIVENKELIELYIENPENTRTIGNLYLGRVRNLMPSIQAAFVDIGQKQDAFLHFSDVDDNLPKLLKALGEDPVVGNFPIQLRARRRTIQEREEEADEQDGSSNGKSNEKRRGRRRGSRPSNSDSSGNKNGGNEAEFVHPARYLRNGQRILVQIIKEPIASKGSRVSSNISLAGRFLVLVPSGDYVAVSRKIWSVRERRRLRALAKSLVPDGFGLIVRTVAEGRDAKTLDTDLNLLLDKWKKITDKIEQTKKTPAVLFQDVSMVSSVVRDLFTDDYDRILIDDQRLHRSIRNYVRAVAPQMEKIVQYYDDQRPIFETVDIADAVAEAFESRVGLPSGGYIFIEHTEAMHVIDVNSGSSGKGKSQEENSLKVNLEAARVIARQLRLRDLGGIIVIDFIDMRDHANRKKVHDELKRAFRKDRAVTKILPMSDFGLMQITRQRLRPSITRDDTLIEDVTKAKAVRDQRLLEEAKEAKAELTRLKALVDEVEQHGAEQHGAEQREDDPAEEDKDQWGSKRRPAELIQGIERWLDAYRTRTGKRAATLRVHPFTAAFLKKGVPSRLTRLSLKHRVRIQVQADEQIAPMVYEFLDPETGERAALPRRKHENRGRGDNNRESRDDKAKSGDRVTERAVS